MAPATTDGEYRSERLTSPSSSLLVVETLWRYIALYNALQASDVDAYLHVTVQG